MKEFLNKCAKKIFYSVYYPYAVVTVFAKYNKEHKRGNLRHISADDFQSWRSGMLGIVKEHCSSCFGFGTRLVYNTFAKANIDVIRCREYDNRKLPIVVLCVKDDIKRLQMLVSHYRKFGVERFAFLDNGSTDGTFEWMKSQNDIDVFKTTDQYNCLVKEGWLNRVISYYGFERWYILTDSDELFTYIGMEKHPINDLVQYAEEKGIKRFKGINIDMYADAALFSLDSSDIDIERTYCWMDTDSYEELPRRIGNSVITAVTGGPRQRMMDVPCSVMKYPLVYFEKGTVSANAHYQYPYTLIEGSPFVVGILHYKFLDSDKKEFERRAQFDTGINAGNAKTGVYYQQYMKVADGNSGMSFMYDGSVKYENSESLRNISLIQTIDFEGRRRQDE